jgi:AcrR family transcriptional regulator
VAIRTGRTSGQKATKRGPRPIGVAGSASRKPRAVGLSRERIVEETVRYLRAHPDEQMTIARAGAAVGATSMAIYRHFRDGADLADAIIAYVLDGLDEGIPRDADWRVQVRAWLEAIYRRLVETPQCVQMLITSRGLSVAWVRATLVLRRSLRAGGLQGRKLGEAVFWVSLTVGGFVQQMLATPLDKQIEGTIAAIDRLEPDERAEMSVVKAEVPEIFTHALDIMFERMLASIEMLMPGKGRG